MTDLSKLRAIVDAATPGPWKSSARNPWSSILAPGEEHDEEVATVAIPRDAVFVSTFNPHVVRALLDVCEAAHQVASDRKLSLGMTSDEVSLCDALAALDEALK